MGKTLTNILVGGIAFTVAALGGEAVLRTVVTLPLPRVLPEVRYAPHPVRRFTLLPDQVAFSYGAPVTIDGRAFRGDGSEPAAPRTTLLALGDSFTFGLGVKNEETWPSQLERLLPDDGVDVVNGGTISYGVFQELDLLRERGLAMRPRLVIHALYWNDFMNAQAPEAGAAPVVDPNGYLAWDGLQPRAGPRQAASTAVSSSALLFSLKQAAASVRAPTQSTGYGAAYDRFVRQGLADGEWTILEAFYRDLQALGRLNGFDVLAVILPVVDIVAGENSAHHPYRVEARRRLERLGVDYVDGFTGQSAATFLPQGRDAHLNALGYKLVAEAVAHKLNAESTLATRPQR